MMCLSASSSEGLITDLLSSDGRCVGATFPLAAGFVQSPNRNVSMPLQTNSYGVLDYATTHPVAKTIGTRETQSRSLGLTFFASSKTHSFEAGNAPVRHDCLSPPLFGAWSAPVSEHGREDGLMCVRLSAIVLLLAQRRSCSPSGYPQQRLMQWLSAGNKSPGIRPFLHMKRQTRLATAVRRGSITSILIRVD
jgi:hypothetical protein